MSDESHLKAMQRHVFPRPAWLALHKEEILEPSLPIVDAHHHLVDMPGNRYLFDDYRADLEGGHNVLATVHVQCRTMYRADGPEPMKVLGETEFANGVAAQSASGLYGESRVCAGIVGAVDVLAGRSVGPILDAHLRVAPDRFKGIRPMTAWHESDEVRALDVLPNVLMQQSARHAIVAMQERGLSLDLWTFFTQLDEVLDLCKAFPDLPVVVNHCGGPLGIGPYRGKNEAVFAEWSGRVRALAALPNVSMKIGGLGMHYIGCDFHTRTVPPTSDDLVEKWKPYVETCIESFRPARCMFESNFPVDKGMYSYQTGWNAFKKITRGYSDAERTALFSQTASRFYRLA